MVCGINTTRFNIMPSKHRSDRRKCELFITNDTVININLIMVMDSRDIIELRESHF